MNANSKILIVDDEPNVRLVFRTTLKAEGYETASADCGSSALDILRADTFDLILLDLQMPGEGGNTILQRLREAGNDTPVVIITAYATVPDAVQAMKLGAIDFIAKPLSPTILRQVVAEVIHRNSPTLDASEKSQTLEHVTASS